MKYRIPAEGMQVVVESQTLTIPPGDYTIPEIVAALNQQAGYDMWRAGQGHIYGPFLKSISTGD